MKLMHEFTAIVDQPLSQVENRLRERLPGWSRVSPGVFAYQGGWWYRGEYHLQPEPGGASRVTHRIYNAASARSRWAVPLANRFFIGFAAQTETAFRRLVAHLR